MLTVETYLCYCFIYSHFFLIFSIFITGNYTIGNYTIMTILYGCNLFLYDDLSLQTLDMCSLLHQIIIIDTRILLEESFYFRWSHYIDMIGCFCMVSVTQHNVY